MKPLGGRPRLKSEKYFALTKAETMSSLIKKHAGTIKTGPGYKAKLKFYDCKSSYECIKACPEQAITQGPERLPANMCCRSELLPGKPEIDANKCSGCGDCISVCPNDALEMVLRNERY